MPRLLLEQPGSENKWGICRCHRPQSQKSHGVIATTFPDGHRDMTLWTDGRETQIPPLWRSGKDFQSFLHLVLFHGQQLRLMFFPFFSVFLDVIINTHRCAFIYNHMYDSLRFSFLIMCICIGGYVHVGTVPSEAKRGRSLDPLVLELDSCELPPAEGSGNQTQVLYKNSTHSQPLSHPSIPIFDCFYPLWLFPL